VILSGAFLAEAAATVDNKLNVSGGVLSKFTVGPDRCAQLVLVVLTRADDHESDRFVDVDIKPPRSKIRCTSASRSQKPPSGSSPGSPSSQST
jgi:hypothetical protein